MQFKQGASVFTAEGKVAAHIDRVVIDPKSRQVTHIVVRKGLLFTQDKVVPIKLIATGEADRIVLKMDTEKLNELPDFLETHYVLLNEEELEDASTKNIVPAAFWYPPYTDAPMATYFEPPYVPETKVNIPKGTVAVKEGARVMTQDNKHIGNVEQVLTRASHDRVSHFIISQGLLAKEKRMIPMGWVASLAEDEVKLAVRSSTIQKLPALEPV